MRATFRDPVSVARGLREGSAVGEEDPSQTRNGSPWRGARWVPPTRTKSSPICSPQRASLRARERWLVTIQERRQATPASSTPPMGSRGAPGLIAAARGSQASRHGGAVGAAAIRSVAQRSCMTSQRRKQRTIVVTQPADAGACRRMYSSTNLRTHAASSCAGSSLTVLSSAWATGNECPIVAAAKPRRSRIHAACSIASCGRATAGAEVGTTLASRRYRRNACARKDTRSWRPRLQPRHRP